MRRSDVEARRHTLLCFACLFVCAGPLAFSRAETSTLQILFLAATPDSKLAELSSQLRAITGWAGLHFDTEGVLRFGTAAPAGGSRAARELLAAAAAGENLLVIEDASGSAEVVF